MKIKLSPQRSDERFNASVPTMEVIRIDDVYYDFRELEEGDVATGMGHPAFAGPVRRVNGEIVVTLLLQHGPNPPDYVLFPDDMTLTAPGAIALPS